MAPQIDCPAKIEFRITRENDLFAHGELVARFATEADAADTAVRFAQDNGAAYSVTYERPVRFSR